MLCKRNKKLSWIQSINLSRTSTKEKKRVLNRKLSLEIYSRFEFSLLFPSLPPPPPCFSFCLWQFSIPICSFVCMFVHQLISLFGPWVRLLCLWSFSVYFFSVRVSFPPHPQSPYSCVTDWWWGDTESIIIYLVCCFIFQELNETSKKLVQSETALEMQTKVFYILSSYI